VASLLIPDLHTHTNFSCDCQATMVEMCRSAVAKGIAELGFTEHFDLIPQDPCFAYFDLSGWWAELERCRELFQGELTIYAGIELGEPHRHAEQMRRLLAEHPWDYALGSLHWVGEELIFDRNYFRKSPDEAYRSYFHELKVMAETADFDVLAHLDVVKRFGFEAYGPFEVTRYEAEIRAVLQAIAGRGLGLEINTSPLRRSVQQTSPAQPVIDWFFEEGGRWLTLGSDAHEPQHVGHELQAALQSAQAAGFAAAARYRTRRPSLADG
jgi:histidinol-phosphatase (PHP family)